MVRHLHGRLGARPQIGEGRRALRESGDGQRLQLFHEVKAAAGAVDVWSGKWLQCLSVIVTITL